MMRRLRWLVVVLALMPRAAAAANITLLEAGTAETQDFSLFSQVTLPGTASVTTTTRNNGRALYVTTNVGSHILSTTTANTRASLWFNTEFVNARFLVFGDACNLPALYVSLDASGHLILGSNTTGDKTGTAVVSTGHWYRLVVAFNIASTSSYTAKLFLYDTDGSTLLDSLTMTNADQSLFLGSATGVCFKADGSGFGLYVSDLYADDGNTLDDPGNISVTFKQPNANATNTFDTAIGANPANRWTNVNELPLSTTNGWEQAASSAASELYGLQGNSDTTNTSQDVSAKTLVGYEGWAYMRLATTQTTPTVTAAAATTTGTAASAAASCAGKATGTTCTTGAFTVNAGDLCVAALADQMASTAPTIASSPASTWNALSGPTTSTIRLSKWYSVMTAGGSTTVTFTFPSSALSRAGAVACFADGAVSTSPLDANATNTTDGTSTYTGPASGALAQANEFVVAFFAFGGPSTDNVLAVSPFLVAAGGNGAGIGTTGGTATANANVMIAYESVSATTTQTPTATDSTSNRAGVQGVASFKRTGATNSSATLTVNGVDTAVTPATTTAAEVFATSASYPSGTFGLKSTGTARRTYFYEGGVLVAYKPGAGTTVVPNRLMLLGVSQ